MSTSPSFDGLDDLDLKSVRQVDLGGKLNAGDSNGSIKSKVTLENLVMPSNTPVSMKYPMYLMKCTTFLSLKENEYAPHQVLLDQGKVEQWEPRHRGKRIAFISHQVS